MSSSPDYNTSESSRSPHSTYEYNNSPSQQVPELTAEMNDLTCAGLAKAGKPYLRITEQPQDYFRFRYVSEMIGTHGCILGKSSVPNKSKSHPTVELINYKKKALLRCQLAQNKNMEEHPHTLLVEDQETDVKYLVPERGSYKVGFAGMGIIHTAKKDVPSLLLRKCLEKAGDVNVRTRMELKAKCDMIAKTIDLNIVRLKFSAHDPETMAEICPPVFSEPIHNMKSASTNDLKICRSSKTMGSPKGGEDIFIFVEKVNRKNIQIWFYEEDENGKTVWEAQAPFLQNDVHHQYAIVFRTPPYIDQKIPYNVEVYFKLLRPSDGKCSEPKQFTYKAQPSLQAYKKRKTMSSNSSTYSSGSGSINDINNVPTTVFNDTPLDMNLPKLEKIQSLYFPAINGVERKCDLSDAMMEAEGNSSSGNSPMWGQQMMPESIGQQLPQVNLTSEEFKELLNPNVLQPEQRHEFMGFLSSLESFSDDISGMLVPDAAKQKKNNPDSPAKKKIHLENKQGMSTHNDDSQKPSTSKNAEPDKYSAFYKNEHGIKVKQLISELYAIIKNKSKFSNKDVREKLRQLFDIRLSNGDTFLHMNLCCNQDSFVNTVKIIHSVKMKELFNCYNQKQQTVLHVAIAYDMPKMVALLVEKGCDPMMTDIEGDTAIHYAARGLSCLQPLLEAIKKHGVLCDLNEQNDDTQTALHLCKTGQNVKYLATHGALCNVADSNGRTPLHIAAYDDNVSVMKVLLEYASPSEIDSQDCRGNTALQIVCDGNQRKNTLEMVKMLLEKQADPLASDDGVESAWLRAQDKPDLMAIIREYLPPYLMENYIKTEMCTEVKSEPETDDSAEESIQYVQYEDESRMADMHLYEHELSAALDYSGGWKVLAEHFGLSKIIGNNSSHTSATRTLLKNIKECRQLSSHSLALILTDIGQIEGANIIKKYID